MPPNPILLANLRTEPLPLVPLSVGFGSEHQVRDFLLNHPAFLATLLGASIDDHEIEHPAGTMRADALLTLDGDASRVALEIQLGKSDSRHLGQVMTYAAVLRPDVTVWVAEGFRAEDLAPIRLANETPGFSIVCVQAELQREPDGALRPVLRVVERPSDVIQAEQLARTGRDALVEQFWLHLAEAAAASPVAASALSNSRSTHQRWVQVSALRGTGVSYRITVASDHTTVSLYIDAGHDADAYNAQVLEALRERRSDVETAFGSDLKWIHDGMRRTSIATSVIGGYKLDAQAAAGRTVKTLHQLQLAADPVLPRLPWNELESLLPPSGLPPAQRQSNRTGLQERLRWS